MTSKKKKREDRLLFLWFGQKVGKGNWSHSLTVSFCMTNQEMEKKIPNERMTHESKTSKYDATKIVLEP